MPSTYSSKLRIELIANGEKIGTWGTATNTNLGTLIEQAIAGVAAVVMGSDANYTLTTNNGSTDEARQAVLLVTSSVSLTATRDIIVPTSTKLYVVHNSTTGAQSIRVKTAAGTGITIPNGERMFLHCDGTNVVDAITNFSAGLKVGGASIYSGGGTDVALADGGTGASLADPGADRILFWDESGNAVTWLELGSGLSISGTTLSFSLLGLGSLADPNADRIFFWDDSAGASDWLQIGTGLAISGTSLALSHLGIQSLADPGADRIMFWDDSAGNVDWLTAGTGLSISATSITLSHLGLEALTDPGADRIAFWDDSAGAFAWLSPDGYALEVSGTTLRVIDTAGCSLSDETTAVTTGTGKGSLVFPFAVTLVDVYVVAATAGTAITVDLNKNGSTILSTKMTIDSGEYSSSSAATPPVISDTAVAAGDVLTWDVDSLTGTWKGLKAWIVYRRAS